MKNKTVRIEDRKREDFLVTYYINEEKKTVAAKMQSDRYGNFLTDFDKYCEKHLDCYETVRLAELGKNARVRLEFTGKAVCAPEDEFNEEIGMRLAFLDLRRNIHSFRMQIAKDLAGELGKELEMLAEYAGVNRKRIKALKNHTWNVVHRLEREEGPSDL